MKRLFKQFSFPGGIPSHVAAETPGSIHEGGELGYALSHAFGAAFDNPDLLVACVVGDGEAETGPLATSWHSNKFLNPARDGAVLPILHLNGYKIAGPTVLARIPREELEALFLGYGYSPYFVEGDEPMDMHQQMAATLDTVVAEIPDPTRRACERFHAASALAHDHAALAEGLDRTEGGGRQADRRQFPLASGADGRHEPPGHVKILEKWLKSYRPQELFDKTGRLIPSLRSWPQRAASHERQSPRQRRPPAARPAAAGFPRLRRDRAAARGGGGEATRVQGQFIRDVIKLNPDNFRVFSPDETNSNRWNAVFEVTNRCSTAEILRPTTTSRPMAG